MADDRDSDRTTVVDGDRRGSGGLIAAAVVILLVLLLLFMFRDEIFNAAEPVEEVEVEVTTNGS
jgi:hypothetical protein